MDVASNSPTEINVGEKGKNSDIKVSGESSALTVGNAESGSSTAKSTINLNTSTLSTGKLDESTGVLTANADDSGSAISYGSENADSKLTVDGAILESKVDITSTKNANVGGSDKANDSDTQIVIKSVAVAPSAKNAMETDSSSESTKAVAKLLTVSEGKFNGKEGYSFVGDTSDFFVVRVTKAAAADVPGDTGVVVEPQNTAGVVEPLDSAEVNNYSDLSQAVTASSARLMISGSFSRSSGLKCPRT